MIQRLLDRTGAHFVFVAGKGGTGKTTTASALALALADQGFRTLLLSTDPAHSLGDVFQQPLDGAAPSDCNPRLILEALDAHAYARRWNAWAEPHLLELIERGTYLDLEDAHELARLTLPGIDELMGAFRLVDAVAEDWQHIVVDTAPTGHTLRLLDAADQIVGFVGALRPMAHKAKVVAARLLRANVQLQAEALLEDLERRARAFRTDVLAASECVVVTRACAVVSAETTRLQEALAARGLPVAALVCTGGGCPEPAFQVPHRRTVRGCSGLRDWGRAEAPGEAVQPMAAGGPAAAPWLAGVDASLVFFAGKGGTGKSTCAAAAALFWSAQGRVELYSTDPAGSLGDVLGSPLGADGLRVSPDLRVRQIDAEAALARLRVEYEADVAAVFEHLGLDEAAALDRRVLDSLWDMAPPGLDELVALTALLEAPEDARLVVDTAPTGHFLRLIRMPELALDWVRAAMRLMIKYHVVALDDAARGVLALARRLKDLRARLLDPVRSAIFVVTLDEPVVRSETERLLQTLSGAGLPVRALIVNRAGADPPGHGPAPIQISAPNLREPPIGTAALTHFIGKWTLVP